MPTTPHPRTTRRPRRRHCRHCRNLRVGRARGLCWKCYNRPAIKAAYAPLGKFGQYGAMAAAKRRPRDRCGYRPLPVTPTDAPPGSVEKIRVLSQRARRGVQLHHPFDMRPDDEAGVIALLDRQGEEPNLRYRG